MAPLKELALRIMAVVLLFAVSAAGLLYLDVQAKSERIALLQREKNEAVNALANLNADVARNREALDEQSRELRALRVQVSNTIEEIINAPPEADAPVAPVLATALVAAERMWFDAGVGDAPSSDRTLEPLPKPWSASLDGNAARVGGGHCGKHAGSDCVPKRR
jgi:uncharacterized coiled-coil protein SlyX